MAAPEPRPEREGAKTTEGEPNTVANEKPDHKLDGSWLRFNFHRVLNSFTDSELATIRNARYRCRLINDHLVKKTKINTRCSNSYTNKCVGNKTLNFLHMAYERRRFGEAEFDEYVFRAIRQWVVTGHCQKCIVFDNMFGYYEHEGKEYKLKLKEGMRIEIQDLVNAPHYNGKQGVVKKWDKNRMTTTGKCGIILDDGNKELGVWPKNLRPLTLDRSAIMK